MLYGTLYFYDALTRPQHLDSRSCDWSYPIQARSNNFALPDTRLIRNCYRSKRVDLKKLFASGSVDCINANIFIHSAEELIPGAVRMYLWRPLQNQAPAKYDITPTQIGQEEFVELRCLARTLTKGTAIGSVVVDAVFTDFQIVILQPCTGVSVYFSPPGISRGPRVGLAVPLDSEAPLTDTFDYRAD